ncbi:MAG TPA: hypothetical protein VEM15_09965, partial [Thermodesulfobacteriota bacterium]|nr:hypothetical protein [Thermodesulfobacteriota bacterium]
DPYEFYENIVEIHMSYPKSHVLNQVKNWPDADQLEELHYEDLVLEFCERLVAHLGQLNQQPN